MADNDRDSDDEPRLTLDQEIARRYEPADLSRMVMRDAGRGEPLDLHTRSEMERRIGGDFSNVRIFRGPLAEEITARYRADAVTIGGTEMVLVRDGWRGQMNTAAGKSLLAHELTHVKQAQRGLHFALAHGPGEGDIEAEAEAVEARVFAEEQGQDLKGRAKERHEMRQRRFLNIVRQEVHKWHEEMKRIKRERGGFFGERG
jgi:hypothetical protein